jgi:RND family efflux transporter MFP subunit
MTARNAAGLAALLLACCATAAMAADQPPGQDEDPGVVRAQLIPRRFTTLSSEIPALVDRISAREGDRFKQGDVLVSLDCALQRSQAAEARAALAGAGKTMAVDRRLLELGSGGALEAAVATADAGKAQARLESATVILSKCAIAAPFPGRVVEQKVREHQYVQAGQAMLEILDDSALEVEFIAPSRWLAWLKPGMPFQLVLDETAKTYPAKVARLGAKVDPVSHSVKITGEIDGSFAELIAGMSGRIQIAPAS